MIAAGLALTLAQLGSAETLYVDIEFSDCGNANGGLDRPFCTIGEAVLAAADGDTIRIAPGLYPESFHLEKDLTLVGVAGAAVTAIDGEFSHRVLTVSLSSTVTLRGLTIQNGNGVHAGGIWNRHILRAYQCTIQGNTGYASSGIGTASGGITSVGVELTLHDCTLTENRLFSSNFRCASALVAASSLEDGAFAEIRDCTISNNTSPSWPGSPAIFGLGASLFLTNSTVSGNVGGGVYFDAYGGVFAEVCRVIQCTIVDNHGRSLAGVSGRSNGTPQFLKLAGSIVAGNSARDFGGDVSGAMRSLGHNLIGAVGPTSGFSSMSGDLRGTPAAPISAGITPLDLAGGFGATHGLAPNSPAIDAGPPTGEPARDQRGVARPDGAVDMGAREMSAGTVVTFCSAQVNSTGRVGRLIVSTDGLLSSNAVSLTALDLPGSSTTVFLAARTSSAGTQPMGSSGTLCLGQDLGRFDNGLRVMSSDALGRVALQIDLTSLPTSLGSASATAGESWYFQAWHRDRGQLAATSSFTSAAAIAWQ